jgi:hypothetical protein
MPSFPPHMHRFFQHLRNRKRGQQTVWSAQCIINVIMQWRVFVWLWAEHNTVILWTCQDTLQWSKWSQWTCLWVHAREGLVGFSGAADTKVGPLTEDIHTSLRINTFEWTRGDTQDLYSCNAHCVPYYQSHLLQGKMCNYYQNGTTRHPW